MTHIEITTYLDAAPEQVREQLKTPRVLLYVTGGLLKFVPVEPAQLPELWHEGRYRVRLKLLGVIPLGWQDIVIELPSPDDAWVVRDNGRGSVSRVWDHRIHVDPEGSGTRYSDRVRLEAGILTPVVALFARLLYTWRQRRWRLLVRNGFDYDL